MKIGLGTRARLCHASLWNCQFLLTGNALMERESIPAERQLATWRLCANPELFQATTWAYFRTNPRDGLCPHRFLARQSSTNLNLDARSNYLGALVVVSS